MKNRTTRQMTMDALMAALCFVLGYIALDLGFIKVTFESFPVLLGALMFGPVDGLIIGGIGTLLCQILKYGFTPTTILWVLPYVALGAIVGRYAGHRDFALDKKQIMLIVVLSHLLLTVMNTASIYADSMIYGYYTFAYVFGSMVLRLVVCVVKAVAYGAILPVIIKALRSSLHLWRE